MENTFLSSLCKEHVAVASEQLLLPLSSVLAVKGQCAAFATDLC